HREGKYSEARFKRGCLLEQKKGKNKDALEGTLVEYIPDPSIFKKFIKYDFQLIQRRLRHYSYLNSGLRLICNGEVFYSKNGILDLLKEEIGEESIYKPIHFVSKILEFTFTHSNRRYGETFYSFVNGQYTSDGGIHLSAFREGSLKGVNEFSKKKFDGEDVRESIVGAISIRLKEPIFESQTKNKLGNTEIRSELVNRVKEIVIDLLHKNRETAERILSKVEDTQQLRKELQKVKKMARERSKTVTFRIPQLKDCKYHLGDKKGKGGESMVFITEGVSAAGSIVSCRDVNTQAIFTLKGKPLNVCDLKRDALYKNDEMYNLMRGLNIEESVDSLRYQKVILATDADVDGLHIRNLLITYFLRFFDALVEREHLFILETPLFRVRNKKETHYCYSEAERDKAVGKLKRGCEITRFKGLGEISPKEFKNFVGSKMKLTRVESASKPVISKILSFYMGRNTPERRNYIMDHLVVDDND
ncbi:MAG TPA: type IIA DNA topoisomerase subunit B, partial [Verrucomicrobia bacterium]|nr:type IIA DNA topoisomerase subunit B [Verrucomicrobiota bacterium]